MCTLCGEKMYILLDCLHSTSEKYKGILKYNVNDKSLFLFFDNESGVIGWEEFIVKKSKLNRKYLDLEKKLLKNYMNATLIDEFAGLRAVKSFIDGTEQAPQGYSELINEILAVKEEISQLEEVYYGSRTKYFSLIEKPMVNTNIKNLLTELSEHFNNTI